jgi:hypothetical protein
LSEFSTLPNWVYLVILVGIVIVAGIAEYIHLAPAGTFYVLFLIVAGIFVPSPLPHPAQPVASVVPAPAPAPTVVEPVVVDRSRG